MALVDRTGKMVKFTIRPGNAAESLVLPTLLADIQADELVADKAYDSNAITAMLASHGIVATIPPRSHRKNPPEYSHDS